MKKRIYYAINNIYWEGDNLVLCLRGDNDENWKAICCNCEDQQDFKFADVDELSITTEFKLFIFGESCEADIQILLKDGSVFETTCSHISTYIKEKAL